MKTRILYTHIWQDDEFCKLSRPAREVVLYLISNRTIGLIPVYKISDREVIFDCLLEGKEELEEIRKEIEKVGIIFYQGYYIMDNNFAQYEYRGGKSKKAKIREIEDLPKSIKDFLLKRRQDNELLVNNWSMIDHINHKSKIINNKSKTKKGSEEGKEFKKSDIRVLGTTEVIRELIEEFPDVDLKHEMMQLKDWQKANGVAKKDWVSYARTWLRKAQAKLKK